MKVFIIQSKKRIWTNKACREALNADSYARVKITHGNVTVERELKRAPAAAARVLRAVQAFTGLFGIAVDRSTMTDLGAKAGDTVQLVNANIAAVQRVSNKPATPRAERATSHAVKGTSLRTKLSTLKIGEDVEVSESAAKSGAYSVAKEVGIKIKKIGPTVIRRTA